MKQTLPLAVVAAAIVIFLFFLSSSKKPPFLPSDDIHKNATTNESCAPCHAPGKQAALKNTHPPKEQCLICHKLRK